MTARTESLRVGLIGLGAVAEAHLAGARDVRGAEVVAAAEIDPRRLDEMTSRWGVKGYPDAAEMIDDEQLDIVCVLTPALTHREVTRIAAERGIHVLCEKPMAVTIEDCRSMIADCERCGVVFGYGSTYRFLPAVRKARELVFGGEIGDVLFLTEHWVGGIGPGGWHEYGPHHYPPGGPGGGGMGLVDHGIHLVDVFRWVTSSEVEAVIGRGNISGAEPQTEFLTMLFESGAVGQLFYNEITFASDLPSEGIFSLGGRWSPDGRVVPGGNWDSQPLSIRVHGTGGALRVYPYANHLFHNIGDEIVQVPLEGPPMPGNFTRQLEAFAECVRGGGEPEATGMDGLRSLAVVLAAYRAFDEQRFVSPQELLKEA
jgi:predicted dehydrogenase